MKLSAWARQQGISYKTAWRIWKSGTLPVSAKQLPTGTIGVHAERRERGVALCAQVSSADQKADLDRQLARLAEFAASQGLVIDVVKEIGAGLSGHRKGLLRFLSNPQVQTIAVEHRDRLMRFGFEHLEASLAAQQRKIPVIEPNEVTEWAPGSMANAQPPTGPKRQRGPSMRERPVFTYRAMLARYAALDGQAQRSLFAAKQAGKPISQLKRDFFVLPKESGKACMVFLGDRQEGAQSGAAGARSVGLFCASDPGNAPILAGAIPARESSAALFGWCPGRHTLKEWWSMVLGTANLARLPY